MQIYQQALPLKNSKNHLLTNIVKDPPSRQKASKRLKSLQSRSISKHLLIENPSNEDLKLLNEDEIQKVNAIEQKALPFSSLTPVN